MGQQTTLLPDETNAQSIGDTPLSGSRDPPLAPLSSHRGKWSSLLFDYDRLICESDFGRHPPGPERLIDQLEHKDDIGLWGAIFNFSHRRRGHDGAVVVWKEILARKCLHQTDGVLPREFWRTVLEVALQDETFLESTWAYAEWMQDGHGDQWPNYYRTIVSFCLENGQYSRAFRWHLRLSPHFDPGRKGFFDILRAFLFAHDPSMQKALQSMYVTSHHRQLYDTIVPLLWSQGYLFRALSWRNSLLVQNDKPTSRLSRPFLRNIAGYEKKNEIELSPEELSIAQQQQSDADKLGDEDSSRNSIFHFVNRVHGKAFGITEKNFNDRIGARWFASSWVSLDTAISAVHDLGVVEIGPLSLQSIALREESPAGILHRLQQLEGLHIGIGQSNYAKAVRHMAKAGDSETLQDLLRSDVHPDVFDDPVLRDQLLSASASNGHWKTYRLVFAARLAVSESSMADAASGLLQVCLDGDHKGMLLKVLDETHAKGIEIVPSTCNAISQLVIDQVVPPFDCNAVPDTDFYAALCRRLTAMRLPVATLAWQKLLMLLSEQGRLDDLETLSLDVVRQYSAMDSSDWTTMKVHVSDVPEPVRQETQDCYYLLPRDLAWGHPLHPVQLLFNDNYTKTVIRCSFSTMLLHRRPVSVAGARNREQPADFYLARGVRLLSMLKERGVRVRTRKVRETVLACLTKLFGPRSMVRERHRSSRAGNRLTIEEMKEMIDDAWGSELLPLTTELKTAWKMLEETAARIQDEPEGLSRSRGGFKRELLRHLASLRADKVKTGTIEEEGTTKEMSSL